jgi:transposase
MIDSMTRLKVKLLAEAGLPQDKVAERCGVSTRSVQRFVKDVGDVVSHKPLGRPSRVGALIRERLAQELQKEPRILGTELLRRSRAWGYTGGRSALLEVVKALRPAPVKEPVILFRGLPGEYAQFDFGEVEVGYANGLIERLHFFAGRLKYSRFAHVLLVPNQNAETVARSIIACIEAFGGSPKEWVFDNPKTIRVSRIGELPIRLHDYTAALVAAYRVIPTFCAPRSGNQKGAVERLVGFVKHSFFEVRSFRDRDDVAAQLTSWLEEINTVHVCGAIGCTPAKALLEEVPFLAERPLQMRADEHRLVETAFVTPMGTARINGTSYVVADRHLGAPATVFVSRTTVEFHVRGDVEVHERRDHCRTVQRRPDQRLSRLANIHGERKRATHRRECLLEVGEPVVTFLTHLVHRHPGGRWEEPCTQLFDILREVGDEAFRESVARCVAERRYTVADVERHLERAEVSA